MRTREHPTPCTDDLELLSLSPSRWRVGDRRLAERPGISLLGFIEHRDDRYEVTRFDSPHGDGVFASFEEAVADFASRRGGREFVLTTA